MSSAPRGGFGGGGARRSGVVALVGAAEDPAVGSMLAGELDRGGAACPPDSSLLSLKSALSKLKTSSDDESFSVRPPPTTQRGGCRVGWDELGIDRSRVRLPRAMG